MLCIKLHPLTSKMHPLKSKMHPPLNRNCTPLPGFYQNYGSLPRIKGIAFAIPFIFLLIRQQGIRTRTVGFADENSPVDCLKVRG